MSETAKAKPTLQREQATRQHLNVVDVLVSDFEKLILGDELDVRP